MRVKFRTQFKMAERQRRNFDLVSSFLGDSDNDDLLEAAMMNAKEQSEMGKNQETTKKANYWVKKRGGGTRGEKASRRN